MERDASFGSWLMERRRALRLSRVELARRVACATVTLRKIEEDARRPSPELAALLAKHLAVAAAECATFVRVARGELPVGQLPFADKLRPDDSPITPLTPLVGRHAEWRALVSRWVHVCAGHAHLVIIGGEAGIGKTRLAEELLGYASAQGVRIAQAHTYAAGELAYAPLLAWLRAPALHESLRDLPDADQIELARLLPELLVRRPALTPPEPLAEPWQRTRLFEALARAVLAARQPLLLLLDDLQWCDQETLDWLHYVLRSAPSAPLLVLTTVRREDSRAGLLQIWWELLMPQEQASLIELGALDERETQALASQLAHGELADADLYRLYHQSEGNPLFVVELTRAMDRSGLLEIAAGAELASGMASAGPLPERIRAVLAARLAQLSPATHELAEVAAVIGRTFTLDLLAAASAAEERVVFGSLEELWQRRIVREQADGSYDFSHDKLREVAYADLSPARRKLLHRRAAEALVQLQADALDPISAQIAAHYDQAGLPGQAVPYYQQSATFASQVGALQEAVVQLERGLLLIRRLPASAVNLQRERDAQVELASVLMNWKGMASPEAEHAYERALTLCRQTEPTAALFHALWGLHEVYMFQARRSEARAMAEQCLELAHWLKEPALLVQAHHAMWGVLGMLFPNELPRALAHVGDGLALYDAHQHQGHDLHYIGHDTRVCALMFRAKLQWLLGYPQDTLQCGQLTIQRGRELGHPFTLTIALNNIGAFYVYRREPAVVRELTSEAIDICAEYHFPILQAEAQIFHGWACAMLGEIEPGAAELYDGIAAWNASGMTFGQSFHQILLAESYLAANQPAAAFSAAEQAVTFGSREGPLEAEAHRLHGVALLAAGASAEQAEESYRQALDIARRQGTRSLELRASVSLARLWQSQGRHADAHRLLAPIYAWFTEGFDTVDLTDARALLCELAAESAEAA